MSSISHRVTALVFAAALSLGLSQAGMAQTAGRGAIQTENVTVYRAKEPLKPPAAKPETKGSPPSADAVRIPGFWDLQGNPATAPHAGWVWVPGRWIEPPFRGARWDPAHWGWRDNWFPWIPGHWVQSRAAIEQEGAEEEGA
jgi:hypothetical protein